MSQNGCSTNVWCSTDAIHFAVENGDFDGVQHFLNNGLDIDSSSTSYSLKGLTPLQLAVRNSNEKITELLLSRGAPIYCTNTDGETLLHIAVRSGHLKIVEHLLNYGVDINPASTSYSSNRFTPLDLAVRNADEKITELLLRRGAHAYCSNRDGETPLHIAARYGYFKIVQHLLNYGADVDSTFTNSYFKVLSPMYIAVLEGNEEITKLLLSRGARANWNHEDYGLTPLHIATLNGNLRIVEHLLNYGADVNHQLTSSDFKGFTPLRLAVLEGSEEVTNLLLSRGAHANYTDQDCETPLHTAAQNGHLQIVKHLLNHGADVNAASRNSVLKGFTPLHFAAEKEHADVVKLLFAYGANANARLEDGSTALDIAYQKRHAKVVETLLLCEEEMGRMKKEMVGYRQVSFHDILTINRNQLAIYTKNKYIVQKILKSSDYKTKFPMYASMINRRFRKGMGRRVLLKQSCNLLHSLFICVENFPGLPQHCLENILSFFSDENLCVLTDAHKSKTNMNFLGIQ